MSALTGAQARAVATWLDDHTADMADLLTRLVACESPSSDDAAVVRVLDVVAEQLDGLGLQTTRLADADPARPARHLEARPADATGTTHQLLLGHLDTVWPLGTTDARPPTVDGDRFAGPGAFDMKAGVVQLIFALRALRAMDLVPSVTPVVLINTDEEIGSRGSREHIARLAGGAVRAFVLEPSFGTEGRLKTARKGIGRFTVTVKGRASHAGLAPEAGISAILEASHQVQRLFAMGDQERGITVNVGTIDGGLGPNVVAPEVTAVVEVRVASARDGETVERAIRGLTPVQAGAILDVQGGFGRPPLERTDRNRKLWEAAREAASSLGFRLDEAAVGGASDGNITSLHTATLDGLGAVGGGAHAADEHVLLSRMPSRAALLATLLMLPAPESHP